MFAQFFADTLRRQFARCVQEERQPGLGDVGLEVDVGRCTEHAIVATQTQIQVNAGMNTYAVALVGVVRLGVDAVLARNGRCACIETIPGVGVNAHVVLVLRPLEHRLRMHLVLLNHARNEESLIARLSLIEDVCARHVLYAYLRVARPEGLVVSRVEVFPIGGETVVRRVDVAVVMGEELTASGSAEVELSRGEGFGVVQSDGALFEHLAAPLSEVLRMQIQKALVDPLAPRVARTHRLAVHTVVEIEHGVDMSDTSAHVTVLHVRAVERRRGVAQGVDVLLGIERRTVVAVGEGRLHDRRFVHLRFGRQFACGLDRWLELALNSHRAVDDGVVHCSGVGLLRADRAANQAN